MRAINLPALTEDGSISRYLAEIHSFPMLSEIEEQNLIRLWLATSDINAAQKVVTSHLRMVPKIASGYYGYGLSKMDLIAEGNLGLMHALKKFDPELGYRFSTYATWWVKASIQDYILRSWSLVKINSTAAKKKLFFNMRKIQNKLANLEALCGEKVDEIKYIAKELDVSERDVIEMNERMVNGVTSLNNIDAETGIELQDTIAHEEENQEQLLIAQDYESFQSQKIKEAMDEVLNEREREIIMARIMQDKAETLDVLSQKYQISKERVRQIEARALEKMKDYLKSSLG